MYFSFVILQTVHILGFVQENKPVFKYLFLLVLPTCALLCPLSPELVVNGGVTETGNVGLFQQCWILISSLLGRLIFNQKDELPIMCELYWLMFFE